MSERRIHSSSHIIEESIIETCLNDLLNNRGDFEVIIADGGSTDATFDTVLRGFPEVNLVTSARGRGRQMNVGAKVARGDIVLFLHADTNLPPHAFAIIREAMNNSQVIGGCFCMRFDSHDPVLRVISLFSRINHLFFTYGDQGLFLRSQTFKEIGGFREMPIMEDVEIQMRLRRKGKFVKICVPVVTSARRFMRFGIVRQQLLNISLVILYHLGVSPATLKRFYRY